jgi:hypothetical protein
METIFIHPIISKHPINDNKFQPIGNPNHLCYNLPKRCPNVLTCPKR